MENTNSDNRQADDSDMNIVVGASRTSEVATIVTSDTLGPPPSTSVSPCYSSVIECPINQTLKFQDMAVPHQLQNGKTETHVLVNPNGNVKHPTTEDHTTKRLKPVKRNKETQPILSFMYKFYMNHRNLWTTAQLDRVLGEMMCQDAELEDNIDMQEGILGPWDALDLFVNSSQMKLNVAEETGVFQD
jgi:hypothetical protein